VIRRVKLQLHHIEGQHTTVDNFPAEDWNEFILIKVNRFFPDEQLAELQHMFQGRFNGKQVIILAHDVDVEFYGLEEVVE
jgi:hypothetical protein